MANFYWTGPRDSWTSGLDSITGLSAFDWNVATNWLEFLETPVSDGQCAPYRTDSGGKPVFQTYTRGIGLANFNGDAGWGISNYDADGNPRSNICRTYIPAQRCPGPGDIAIVGDDVLIASTPLLFGGFQGGSTGGTWLNAGPCNNWDDQNGICLEPTDATGTTYNSALTAFYYGGLFAGHPDMNYVWGRLGGGFTHNNEKYAEYQLPAYRDLGKKYWDMYFNGATFEDQRTGETVTIGTFFKNVTWADSDLTPRTQKLTIKAERIQEAVRCYAGISLLADLNVEKNIQVLVDERKQPGDVGYTFDGVATWYERCSRNMTSYLSGWINTIYNKPADTQSDWYGVVLNDEVHDAYYGNRNERLVLRGVTAGAVRSYISDQITIGHDSSVGSVWLDDAFKAEEDRKYALMPDILHEIAGVVDKDAVATVLGLTGTSNGDALDSTVNIHADVRSFETSAGVLKGAFTVNLGNSTGLTGITCTVRKVDVNMSGGAQSVTDGRPGKIKFVGAAPVVIDLLNASNCVVAPGAIDPENYVSIGNLNLSRRAWFWPGANPSFTKYFFGTRPTGTVNFFGGINFNQEADLNDSQTSVLMLIPEMKLHNAAVGITFPARLTGLPYTSPGMITSPVIANRNPGT
jgi:hypothetical protein